MAGTLIKILFLLLPFNTMAQMFGSLAADDQDAYTLFTTAAITETAHRDGLNILVKDYKSYGLWATRYAMYPLAGSTASQHKWNLKDIRDADVAFRLTYTNTPTSSANGIDFNGSTQFADTHFNAFPSLDSRSISTYLRENTAFAGGDMGNTGSAANDGMGIYARWIDNSVFWNTDAAAFVSTTSTDSRGDIVVTRTASNARAIYQNGSSVQTSTTASSASSVKNIFIGCDNGLVNYSNRQTAFIEIGAGLSAAQVTIRYAIIQRYQTKLGRQVP